jgi:hypothetical protein
MTPSNIVIARELIMPRAILRMMDRSLFNGVALFLFLILPTPSPVTAMSLNEIDQPLSSESKLAQGHAVITQRIQETAAWLDSFFGDKREDEELASSSLRFGLTSRFLELEPAKHRIFLRGKVVLPNLERRVQLVFEGSDDGGLSNTADQQGSSSIRYSIKDTEKKKLSLDAGFRGGLTNSHIFTRLRLRNKIRSGEWLTRVTPALIYDTREGWEAFLRVDNERKIGQNIFFRSTTRPVWADKEIGISVEQDFTIYKRISRLRYLAFDWLSKLINGEHTKLAITQLRIRHRRAIWRDKLFLEFSPGLRFADEHEHRLQWEGYITMEMLFSP